MQSAAVPASMEYLERVVSLTEEVLSAAGCGENDLRLILISAEEIFTNIASYAYGKEQGTVWLQCGVLEAGDGKKEAVVCFQDRGLPYDPFAGEDPDLSLPIEERPVGGLGVYMVKQFMDQADYQYKHGRNITTLRKVFFAG